MRLALFVLFKSFVSISDFLMTVPIIIILFAGRVPLEQALRTEIPYGDKFLKDV